MYASDPIDDGDDIVEMLRDSAEDFTSTQLANTQIKVCIGQPRAINRVIWTQMAELGWLGLALPERLGGSGMGVREAAALCEVFGRTLFTEPFVSAVLLPALVLTRAEGHAAQSQLCTALGEGTQMFALAWQESAGEIEPLPPGVRLLGSGQEARLHGVKRFVHAVESDSMLLVSAQRDRELVIVAVNASTPGVRIDRSATAQGNVCDISFDNVALAHAEPLLVGAGAHAALVEALTAGRIAVSAQLAGLARGCLDKTLKYVTQREQFGRALGSFQSVAHRCVNLRIGVELAESTWQNAAQLYHAAQPKKAVQAAVCAAKARCNDVAFEVGRVGVQLHGAMGFTEETDIGMYLRATMQYASWLGGSMDMRRRFIMADGALRTQAAVSNASDNLGKEVYA